MILGLNVDEQTEQKILNAFDSWATHFNQNFQESGIDGLVSRYAQLIETHETQSCPHGTDGIQKTGDAFRYCCGISYEYINDLSCRDALQIIIDLLPPYEAENLTNLLIPFDNRLKSLQKDEEFVLNKSVINKYPKEKYWWLYGLPVSVEP